MALADKPAVPFRVPAGIKLIRIDPKSGMRAGPGAERVILEAFKPGTAPPDTYSVVGYSDSGRRAISSFEPAGGQDPIRRRRSGHRQSRNLF